MSSFFHFKSHNLNKCFLVGRLGSAKNQMGPYCSSVKRFITKKLHLSQKVRVVGGFGLILWGGFWIGSLILLLNLFERVRAGVLDVGFFVFEEELLGMGTYLRAVSGADQVFNFFPILAKHLESWMSQKGTEEEVFMLLFGPSAVSLVSVSVRVGHDSNLLFLRFKIIIY